MKIIGRILKQLFLSLVLLSILLVSFIAFLLYTNPGLQVALILANIFIKGDIQVVAPVGRLLDGVSFAQINYSDDNRVITLKNIRMEWDLRTLLEKKIAVQAYFDQVLLKPKNGITQSIKKGIFRLYGERPNAAALAIQSAFDAQYQDLPFSATYSYQNSQTYALAKIKENHVNLKKKPDTDWYLNAEIPRPDQLHPALKELHARITAEGILKDLQKGSLNVVLSKGDYGDKAAMQLAFEGGEIKLELNKYQLKADGNIDLGAHKKLTTAIILPDFKIDAFEIDAQKILGNVHFDLDSLDFLSGIHPLITKVEGQVLADLMLSGKLKQPKIEGKLALHNAQVILQQLGLNIKPLKLAWHTIDKKWNLKGTLFSNGKPLQIEGSGDIFPKITGQISFKGMTIPVLNNPEYFIAISPDLHLEIAPALLKLRGNILVPNAKLQPTGFTDTVSLSDDAVIVENTEQAKPSNRINLDADVAIEMGNDVALAVKGLKGFLDGKINLLQVPGKPLNAIGKLVIRDGIYQAYGQDLKISEGQLDFTGEEMSNPRILLRAVKQFNNAANKLAASNRLSNYNPETLRSYNLGNKVTVGIELNGRISSNKISLFSIPSNISQADILSYLILGKPARENGK